MDIIGKSPINPFIFYSGKICGYIIWILIMLSYFDVEIIPSIQQPALRSASSMIIVIGVLFIVLSSVTLGKSILLGLPEEKTALRTGVYTISRNPMYLGFDPISSAAILGIMNIVVAIMGIYSIVVYHFSILGEERFFQKRFDQEYTQYMKEVRRYL